MRAIYSSMLFLCFNHLPLLSTCFTMIAPCVLLRCNEEEEQFRRLCFETKQVLKRGDAVVT